MLKELKNWVRKQMMKKIIKQHEQANTEDEILFCMRVGKCILEPEDGQWLFMTEDVPDYPFSPIYGTLFLFKLDDTTYFFGKNGESSELNFCEAEQGQKITAKNFVWGEDMFNVPIGDLEE